MWNHLPTSSCQRSFWIFPYGICQDVLKSDILLHKRGFVGSLQTTVCTKLKVLKYYSMINTLMTMWFILASRNSHKVHTSLHKSFWNIGECLIPLLFVHVCTKNEGFEVLEYAQYLYCSCIFEQKMKVLKYRSTLSPRKLAIQSSRNSLAALFLQTRGPRS